MARIFRQYQIDGARLLAMDDEQLQRMGIREEQDRLDVLGPVTDLQTSAGIRPPQYSSGNEVEVVSGCHCLSCL